MGRQANDSEAERVFEVVFVVTSHFVRPVTRIGSVGPTGPSEFAMPAAAGQPQRIKRVPPAGHGRQRAAPPDQSPRVDPDYERLTAQLWNSAGWTKFIIPS